MSLLYHIRAQCQEFSDILTRKIFGMKKQPVMVRTAKKVGLHGLEPGTVRL